MTSFTLDSSGDDERILLVSVSPLPHSLNRTSGAFRIYGKLSCSTIKVHFPTGQIQ